MFSILQKSQDAVNAEDLETLQNEIEKRLVGVVTKKWELERELLALSTTSPDVNSSSSTPVPSVFTQTNNHSTGGKLRNSSKISQNEVSENASDCFKTLNNNGISGNASGFNSVEDSVSSEGSIVSSFTNSTIITTTLPDVGSQPQTTNSSTSLSNKRSHKSNNDRPCKRFRQNSSNSVPSTGTFPKRPPHSKHRSKVLPVSRSRIELTNAMVDISVKITNSTFSKQSKFRNALEESRPNKKQVLKNEAPDKLWPFVEQFCATPTEEQINDLDEMIKSKDNDKEYFKVPSLGKRDTSSKDSHSKTDNGGKSQKRSKARGDEETGLGALTQRLVSSLMEEDNSVTSSDAAKPNAEASPKKKNARVKGGKNIDMNNAKNLEKRIRQGLEEYDILSQQDDIPYASEDDEVLRELVASQHELLSIQSETKESMKMLLKKAKKHVELEAEREKLRDANPDVIAAYYRLIQLKQRKRNPSKKEKDAAWKAVKVHEAIFKKCDDLYMSSLNKSS